MYYIKNIDCFEYLKNLENRSIDLFLLDLPYGITSQEWDNKINLSLMWDLIKQKITISGYVIFFCNTKFGYELIQSNPSWYCYDLIWEKVSAQGFLNAKKKPLTNHEMIYIFKNEGSHNDINVEYNKLNREYAKKIYEYMKLNDINLKSVENHCGSLSHFTCYKGKQFRIPDKNRYDKLCDFIKIKEEIFYITYDELLEQCENKNKESDFIYNPQMTKAKHCKVKNDSVRMTNYGLITKKYTYESDIRYPKSILKFNYDKEKFHSTQKPTDLLSWLILTYTNKNMNVCDFTMGSGSTCISCINTDRNFYGCELDTKIFNIAVDRIEKHNLTKNEI